jgi:hypothetical protein
MLLLLLPPSLLLLLLLLLRQQGEGCDVWQGPRGAHRACPRQPLRRRGLGPRCSLAWHGLCSLAWHGMARLLPGGSTAQQGMFLAYALCAVRAALL